MQQQLALAGILGDNGARGELSKFWGNDTDGKRGAFAIDLVGGASQLGVGVVVALMVAIR